MTTSTTPVATPQAQIIPDAHEGDESDETEVDNIKEKAGVFRSTNNNNDVVQLAEEEEEEEEEQGPRSGSSTAHTDSENDDVDHMKFVETKKPREDVNRNDSSNANEKEPLLVKQDDDKNAQVLVKARNLRPPTPGSPRKSLTSSLKKKLKESCDEEESSSDELFAENPKESYVQLRLRRKTLLKIEKFTDSDSRSRERMRSRALSPPTSSDEENLHIGWVAYPAALSSPREQRRSNHRGQRAACACAHALKCIFSPMTKVCQKCRVNNKVWDSDSLQEKLLSKDDAVVDKKLEI